LTFLFSGHLFRLYEQNNCDTLCRQETHEETHMRAIIIGGGIAGPVTALALRRAGIDAVVYEAHDGPAPSLGLFLGLGVNGLRVLEDLDLLEPLLRAASVPTPSIAFSSGTGKRIGVVSNGRLPSGVPSLTIMRGELQRVLADAARDRGVELRYGKRFVEYVETDAGVVAHFADGSTAEGELLIGADGIRSRVRARMSPDAPAPRYTGLLNLGGVARGTGLEPTPDTMHMIWGRRAFFGYTVLGTGDAWWFANLGMRPEPDRAELAAIPTADWKRRLRALFEDDPPSIAAMIEATDEIGAFPIHDMPSLPCWHRGRVVLVGDAAHAVSPSTGQGASLAFEDAVMLARCLRDIADPEAAFGRYEALRRPRAERIVAVGRKRGEYKALESRAAVMLRDLLMPIVFRIVGRKSSTSWIRDYTIPWDERVA
jgi:2-polyprenyl-6-methoxyphenol hydroxylase-like FAD-dependent oxidoreductase